MDIAGYSAHILVNGRKVKEYRFNGKTYIEAREGSEFTIQVKNHRGGRILAQVSVDGIDIISGKPITDNSQGYVIPAFNTNEFKGWRTSDTEVGAFKFTGSGGSYADSQGKGQNNGVIGVRLISEKVAYGETFYEQARYLSSPTPKLGPIKRSLYSGQGLSASPTKGLDSNLRAAGLASACAASSEPVGASFDMGTTWGQSKEDKVVKTEFQRGSNLGELVFYYASREALINMGVPVLSTKEIAGGFPQAFPNTYAQPPKDWRG